MNATASTRQNAKPVKKKLPRWAYAFAWATLISLIYALFSPRTFSIPEKGVLTFRIAVFSVTMTANFLFIAVTGWWAYVGHLWRLFWFPITSFFRFLWSSFKAFLGVRKFHRRVAVRLACIVVIAATVMMAMTTQIQWILDTLRWISYVMLASTVVRVSERAFNPLGIVDTIVGALLKASEKKNFIPQMMVNFFRKTQQQTAKSPVSGAAAAPMHSKSDLPLSKSIANASNVMRILFKVPEIIQNPKIPFVIFMATFVPAVISVIFLFAVIFKSTLLGNPAFGNENCILASFDQFFGSSFHGLQEIPASIRWPLAIESAVKFYFEVIAVLGFSLILQSQTASLGKRVADQILVGTKAAFQELPKQLQGLHSEKDVEEIQSSLRKVAKEANVSTFEEGVVDIESKESDPTSRA